ncbi:MAG: hypothetical protein J6A36_04940 [Clostridia bacterium]|nr:hypothetical protein [Clostridia bacterium]
MGEELTIIEDKNINVQNELKSIQEQFLKSSLGNVVNNAVDIGLKSVLPDLIEDEVIKVKDTILENGFKEGLNEAVNTVINFGKSAIGIVTGNFENMNQVDIAIKKGGMIDTVSDLLDMTIEKIEDKNLINKTTANLIKKGKNSILDSVADKIEDTLENQVKNIEKIKNYSEKWKESFDSKDLESMTKNFKNIEKYLKETMPLENTIKEARKIENLQNLIKNNGGNFDITTEEMQLAEKLTY